MPELAEVEYYRKRWMCGAGWRVQEAHVRPAARVYRDTDAQALALALVGAELREGRAHGKRMLFRFGDSVWLEVHLGMTGSLACVEQGQTPGRHDHLVLRCGEGSLIFTDPRMFGRLSFETNDTLPAWWSELPPQPGTEQFTQQRLEDAVTRHARAPIKAVLLDQAWFPGLGNWMVDEILWRARVHPATAAGRIDPAHRGAIHAAIQFVSREAMATIGVDWRDPPEDWLFLHRWKDGGTCPQTGQPLRRETIGGRTTCYSPAWQSHGTGGSLSGRDKSL